MKQQLGHMVKVGVFGQQDYAGRQIPDEPVVMDHVLQAILEADTEIRQLRSQAGQTSIYSQKQQVPFLNPRPKCAVFSED